MARTIRLTEQAEAALDAFRNAVAESGHGIVDQGETTGTVGLRDPRNATESQLIEYAARLAYACFAPDDHQERIIAQEAAAQQFFTAMREATK